MVSLKHEYLVSVIVLINSFIGYGCSSTMVAVSTEGSGMMPFLKNGDKEFFLKSFGEIKRGDIIYFEYPGDRSKFYVKRVIGLPGETVTISEGRVFVNNKEFEEPYVNSAYNISASSFPSVYVEEDHYYVLGDNRDSSSDSRYWGTVNKELVIGKYYLTYWNSN